MIKGEKMKILTVLLFVVFSADGWAKCYRVNPQDVEFKFTGYKFTEKVGVEGSFDQMQWAFTSEASNPYSLLASASVWIDSFSINAGNAARNKNITKGLFKNIVGGRYIRGFISKVNPDGNVAVLKLFLGNLEIEVPLVFQKTPTHFILKGTLDLLGIGAKKGFRVLSKICAPLHRGKDGKSKSWPTVDLEVRAKYSERCGTSR